MKFRKLLTLLALLTGVVFSHAQEGSAQNQVQPVESASTSSAGSLSLIARLKAQVDPNYVNRLESYTDHSQKPDPPVIG